MSGKRHPEEVKEYARTLRSEGKSYTEIESAIKEKFGLTIRSGNLWQWVKDIKLDKPNRPGRKKSAKPTEQAASERIGAPGESTAEPDIPPAKIMSATELRDGMIELALEKLNDIAMQYGMSKADVIELGMSFMIAYNETAGT